MTRRKSNPSYPPFPDLHYYITPPSPSVSYTLPMMPTTISSRLASPPTSILAPQTVPDPHLLLPFHHLLSNPSSVAGKGANKRATTATYTFDRRKPDGTFYWQCRDKNQYTPACTGRLYKLEKESVKRSSDHNHPPSV